jgi:hypothetical protein
VLTALSPALRVPHADEVTLPAIPPADSATDATGLSKSLGRVFFGR